MRESPSNFADSDFVFWGRTKEWQSSRDATEHIWRMNRTIWIHVLAGIALGVIFLMTCSKRRYLRSLSPLRIVFKGFGNCKDFEHSILIPFDQRTVNVLGLWAQAMSRQSLRVRLTFWAEFYVTTRKTMQALATKYSDLEVSEVDTKLKQSVQAE